MRVYDRMIAFNGDNNQCKGSGNWSNPNEIAASQQLTQNCALHSVRMVEYVNKDEPRDYEQRHHNVCYRQV